MRQSYMLRLLIVNISNDNTYTISWIYYIPVSNFVELFCFSKWNTNAIMLPDQIQILCDIYYSTWHQLFLLALSSRDISESMMNNMISLNHGNAYMHLWTVPSSVRMAHLVPSHYISIWWLIANKTFQWNLDHKHWLSMMRSNYIHVSKSSVCCIILGFIFLPANNFTDLVSWLVAVSRRYVSRRQTVMAWISNSSNRNAYMLFCTKFGNENTFILKVFAFAVIPVAPFTNMV